jgi:ABC-type branched-subunit amino acid transport system ATPase component
MSVILSAEDIHAGYGKKEVLRGVSVELNEGEIVALVGPNGAGKSTLLKVIAGFLKPSNGRVMFSGNDISYSEPSKRARMGIGYFMQGGKVFPTMTVGENLRIGIQGMQGNGVSRNTEEVLSVFPNLKDMLTKRAGLLSGGERQALALGMILATKPEVLLLDEPSAGLSPKLAGDIFARVGEVSKNWHVTVLLVEQNVRQALSLADRVYILQKGEVVEDTLPKDLLDGEKLQELFLGIESADPSAKEVVR